MNFEPSDDQAMIATTFARFLDEHSSIARVRAALPSGFDPDLWRGIAEMGGFGLRVPEEVGGLGLGLFDAALLMAEVGRTLASGPVGEAIVTARILGLLGDDGSGALENALAGTTVIALALHDTSIAPTQWIAGGAVADAVLACDGEAVFLVAPTAAERQPEPNLASTPIAEIRLDRADRIVIATGADAVAAYRSGIEEWKLLTAAALAGLSREALRLAAVYASEREQFGQPIGTYQGISHPLADILVETDGGKYLVWKAIRDIADGAPTAGAEIALALWWNARAAGRAVAQALHTFGGYGLTTDYDIHLYNLRAKALPLILGDPARSLDEAGRRLYADETTALPDVGAVTIDFALGTEAHTLAGEVDCFFQATLTPDLRAKSHYSFAGHDPGVHQALARAGLLFPGWRPEIGGRGAAPYAVHAAYEIWEDHGWTTHAVGTTGMVGAIIDRFGSDEVKRDVLSKIVAGEAICSLGFSEPHAGSDVFSARTRAVPDGNGWRIDGQKMFTSGADIADYVLMLTRTDVDLPKHKGLTMFVVPLKADGITIQPVHTFQGERTNVTYYDGVRIPDSYRLGEVGGGIKVMAASLELEQGASWLGTQRHMLRAAETFCRETERGGRPMIADPAVISRLAKVFADTLVTELLTYRALWAGVEKKPNAGFGSMIKLFSSETFRVDAADLLDLAAPESLSHRAGSAAYINLCYRHAQGTTIYGGTSEVHRSIVAERALDLPRTRT